MFADGRPTIDYVPRDSTGAEQEKYVIVGDRVRMKGEDRLWAGGRVTIDRSDVSARADSMRLDTGAGQDGALIGRAQVDGLGKDPFSLTGSTINLRLEQNDLTYVQANGAGKAVSADWTLVADTIGLDVNARVLEQTLAWGSAVRPHAVSATYEITRRLPGARHARQGADRGPGVREGVGGERRRHHHRRARLAARRHRHRALRQGGHAGKSKTVVHRVESWKDASSFYQVFDPARPGVPSLNYARGNRILVLMKDGAEGGVERVEIQGKVDGVQLEPKPAAAKDTTAAAPPTPAVDSTPGAVQP